MNRETAITAIMDTVSDDDIIIATTGLISREVFERFDSVRNFYNPGAMGLVSSIGLGIALSTNRRVIVIDGDSSLLMNLGTLVTIGYQQPGNLLHIVINNESFGSCSEERSMSGSVSLSGLAAQANYASSLTVFDEISLKNAILETVGKLGFVDAKIELGGRRDFKRPLDLVELKHRFMHQLKGEVSS